MNSIVHSQDPACGHQACANDGLHLNFLDQLLHCETFSCYWGVDRVEMANQHVDHAGASAIVPLKIERSPSPTRSSCCLFLTYRFNTLRPAQIVLYS